MASALLLTLVAGLTLPFLIVAGTDGVAPWASRLQNLKQAHGAIQLQGWAGLVVAGMALRLVPRFAGRKPLRSAITVTVLVLMLAGVLSRTVAQTILQAGTAGALLVVGALLAGGGVLLFVIALAITLVRGWALRPWSLAVSVACLWWVAWSLLNVHAATVASSGRFANQVEVAGNWLALFGAIGNFVWAVQSRSVPIFYGRRSPDPEFFAWPLAVYNTGLLAFLAGVLPNGQSISIEAIGLVALGLGTISLAPLAGSVWGKAFRLRPASQPLSRFIIAANLWAIVAGVMMVVTGLISLVSGTAPRAALVDAAFHAIALGTVTLLIIGMAQLVNPVFAIQRAGTAASGAVARWIMFIAIVLAAALRVLAGTAVALIPITVWSTLIAVSGSLAWVGLATFALVMGRSWLTQGRLKAELASRKLRPES